MGSHLDDLEDEAVFVLREVTAERERPVLLFSGGKDSAILLHLAKKAFAPGRIPFPVLHVDTGHNFPEVIAYRDELVRSLGVTLFVASVEEAIRKGTIADVHGPRSSRNRLQSVPLLEAIAANKFDVAFGGARRDEDRARAKERVVSVRDAFGQWDPQAQRPELFGLLNTAIPPGGHLRCFPISNFTEVDVWEYVEREDIPLPSLYFSHDRDVFERDGMLYAVTPFTIPEPSEVPFRARVRFRTVGDATCTGAVRSHANSLEDILHEVRTARTTERGATRADDRATEAAMEDRKREGYF